MNITSILTWGITSLFIVVLIGGFLVGFWRGFKKSALNTVCSLAGVIVAFFVTPPITKAILNMNIKANGNSGSLSDMMLKSLLSNDNIEKVVNNNPNLKVLITNLPAIIVNTVMVIFVTIAIECVLYFIFKIFAIAFFRKSKGGRWFGGLLGLVKTFIVAIMAFMPLAGFIGYANSLTKEESYGIVSTVSHTQNRKNLAADYLPDTAKSVITGLENNMLIKCSSIFGLDNAMFDYYANINIDGEKLEFRKELTSFYRLADFAYQLSGYEVDNVDYTLLDYNKIQAYTDDAISSTLFGKVIAPLANDVIVNHDTVYSFINFPDNVKDVLDEVGKNINDKEDYGKYYGDDLKNVIKVVKIVGKQGIVNDLVKLEDKSMMNVIKFLTNDDNAETIEQSTQSLLKLNLVKDNIDTLINKASKKLPGEIDEIDVDGRKVIDEQSASIAHSIIEIAKNYCELNDKVDINDFADDPLVMLRDKSFNIGGVCDNVGVIIDSVRANPLLKNSEGNSIIDRALNKGGFALNEYSSYSEMLGSTQTSLELIRSSGLYDIIDRGNNVIKEIAELISQEGKETLLSDSLLPLYKIDFVKDNVFDKFAGQVNNKYVNFAVLKNYADWEYELDVISKMFISLNKANYNGKSYLDYTLEGDFQTILENITTDDVDNIFGNLLYAKSTEKAKIKIFEVLKEKFEEFLTDGNLTLSAEGIDFSQEKGQTEEVCNVIKAYIEFNASFASGDKSFKNADVAKLGKLLNALKVNAYRKELDKKEQDGVFNNVFVTLANKLGSDYQTELDALKAADRTQEVLGVPEFSERYYSQIDFETLLGKLHETIGA